MAAPAPRRVKGSGMAVTLPVTTAGAPLLKGVKLLTTLLRATAPPLEVKGESNTKESKLKSLSSQSMAVTPPEILIFTTSAALKLREPAMTSLKVTAGLARDSSSKVKLPVRGETGFVNT
jgi:hypothetical protein